MKDLSVIIPAYNEAGTISQVIEAVLAQPRVKEAIVVNDGSKDSTSKVLKKYKERVTIIDLAENTGKGASVRKGLEFATGNI